jgi:DNA ligase-1
MSPLFMRAESYVNRKTRQPDYSATGYFLSEKFDGQRAQWDPISKRLISRYGNTITCPAWFLGHFHGLTVPVDGELFMGYGNWDLTGLFRQVHPDEGLWRRVKFIVFDIADTMAGTFIERRAKLESLYRERGWGGCIELATIKQVHSSAEIKEEFDKVIARGGEGVMLNSPLYTYCDGKSTGILKYKHVMDEQCLIVNYKMGKGRLEGKLGSFVVYPIENGQPQKQREFSLSGMNDAVRESYVHTHPIGTVLNYRCAEMTKDGKPKHPVYLGIYRGTCMKVPPAETIHTRPKITLKAKMPV